MTDSTLLSCVAIPPKLRGFGLGSAPLPDDQAFDVLLAQGQVASIAPVAGDPSGTLLSGLVDLHVHLDKNFTVKQTGAVHGDLFAAIERIAHSRAQWTAADLHQRMTRALEQAFSYGTRALRTHLDWFEDGDPLSVEVLQSLRTAWAGRLALQWVSLTPLDLLAQAGVGQRIARAVKAGGGVLGAFVYRNADMAAKLQRVFELAMAHGLWLDFHVDEGLDADAEGLRHIAQLCLAHGLAGRVTCGHACSLSVQAPARALETLALCAQAGIHLVALPTTNLYLQGSWAETPVPRGITRVKEAAALGVPVSIATDNVADVFYPYGSYDLLESYSLGVQMAHLAPALDWLGSITCNPAAAMGLPWDGRLRVGCPADLVVLAARDGFEVLSPAGRQRQVWRQGQLIQADGHGAGPLCP